MSSALEDVTANRLGAVDCHRSSPIREQRAVRQLSPCLPAPRRNKLPQPNMAFRLSALIVYFASGFAALLYQVVWQRTLVIFSGTDVRAATIVVAAFMAGLGCGSLAGGVIADRLSRRASLLVFAAAELAIGAFGAISALFFYRVLYVRLGGLGLGFGPTAGVLFGSLLWPTFFMGASLPLIARALAASVGGAASTIGALYACNTLGAAGGALCATWVFLPVSGVEGTVRVAVAVNVACAMAALSFVATLRRATPALRHHAAAVRVDEQPEARPTEWITSRTGTCAALFALSGFLALSFEIVWFRLLAVMQKGTTYTFGSVLAVYLLSLGAGAAAGSALARRMRRPMIGFLALQAAAGLYAVLVISLLVAGLNSASSLRWFADYFRGSEGLDVRAAVLQLAALAGVRTAGVDAAWPTAFLRLYALLPTILIGPAVAMIGASFPLLQKAVHDDL